MKEKGFTLIELLVVVAIIGILAAIAIPQFAAYRERAFDSAAQSDLRNVMTAEEAYFVDNLKYTAVEGDLPGFTLTDNVTLTLASPADSEWNGNTIHASGDKRFCYDSTTGSGMTVKTGGGAC